MNTYRAPVGPSRYFTLIELLVVVAIISVLAAMLLPALQKAQGKARNVSCMAGVKQITMSWGMYVQDNEGHHPATLWTAGQYIGFRPLLAPYGVDNRGCPYMTRYTSTAGSYGIYAMVTDSGGSIRDWAALHESEFKIPTDTAPVISCCWTEWWPNLNLATTGEIGRTLYGYPNPSSRPRHQSQGLPWGFADGHAQFVLRQNMTTTAPTRYSSIHGTQR